MKLPVQFPTDADVIAEESRRFGALSSQERLRLIRGILDAGALMMRNSPQAAFLAKHSAEQEDASRQAIREFLARHAN